MSQIPSVSAFLSPFWLSCQDGGISLFWLRRAYVPRLLQNKNAWPLAQNLVGKGGMLFPTFFFTLFLLPSVFRSRVHVVMPGTQEYRGERRQ